MTIYGFDLVRDILPWFMSAITLWMTFLQGRKTWKAYAWGLINQLLWLAFIFNTHTWGLLPLNAGLWFLYWRNLVIWYDDERTHMQALFKQRMDEKLTHEVQR